MMISSIFKIHTFFLQVMQNPRAKSFSRAVLTSHRLVSDDKNQSEIRKKAIVCEEIFPDLSFFRIPFWRLDGHFSLYKLAKTVLWKRNWTKQFRNLFLYNAVYKFCAKHVIFREKVGKITHLSERPPKWNSSPPQPRWRHLCKVNWRPCEFTSGCRRLWPRPRYLKVSITGLNVGLDGKNLDRFQHRFQPIKFVDSVAPSPCETQPYNTLAF